MMARTFRVILVAVVAVALAGFLGACGPKKSKTVMIDSQPQGAKISIDSEEIGETPRKVDLSFPNPKNDRHVIKLYKKGYTPSERYYYFRDNEHVMFLLEESN